MAALLCAANRTARVNRRIEVGVQNLALQRAQIRRLLRTERMLAIDNRVQALRINQMQLRKVEIEIEVLLF